MKLNSLVLVVVSMILLSFAVSSATRSSFRRDRALGRGRQGEVERMNELFDGDSSLRSNGNSFNSTCDMDRFCYTDKECGESGRCTGSFIGTCNCGECLDLRPCTNDSACGGLRDACNLETNRCDCIKALVSVAGGSGNSFSYANVLQRFCNVRSCANLDPIVSEEQCFGLPCRMGRCSCAH